MRSEIKAASNQEGKIVSLIDDNEGVSTFMTMRIMMFVNFP